jgi:predicted RNA-binding Zn-ribbon protein involved in translation (DUF1610 family)
MDKTTGRTDSTKDFSRRGSSDFPAIKAATKAVQAYLCASCQRRYIGLQLFVCPQCGRALQATAINHLPAQRVAAGPRRCCGH